MKTWKILTAAAAATLAMTACQGPTGQQGGALIGGVAGALAGSQFGSGTGQLAAVAAGTLLGAFVGSEIGAYMDQQDQMLAQQAFQQASAAPVSQPVAWSNPQSGHSGVVGMDQGFSNPQYSGRYCRDYYSTVVIDQRQETVRGTACQNADGTWEIVES